MARHIESLKVVVWHNNLLLAAFAQARQKGLAYQVEHRIRSAARTYRWFLVRAEPYRDPQTGAITRWYGASVDIDDRKRAEEALLHSEAGYRQLSAELGQKVQQRTQQLQESVLDLQCSNENLQQFAYIASHDLQEPLRKIQQFGDLLKTQYAPASGEALVYVKSDRVWAHELPAGVNPARPVEAYYQIEAIDNGIGFDEKYVDRIFQVFQRLHGQHAYGGTGIGLAICAKVVVDHGGAITARSQRGRALRLSSTYPLKQEVHSISLE